MREGSREVLGAHSAAASSSEETREASHQTLADLKGIPLLAPLFQN
jgi:hypothetical protein